MVPASRSLPPRRAPSGFQRLAFLGLLAAATATCTDSVAGPDDGGEALDQIYFLSTRAGALGPAGTPLADIYRMNADGSGVERLTTQSAAYRFLRLSPDGDRLVFYADLGACYDIYVMNLDGSGLTQLTGVAGYERCNETPHWSPDGTRIAFMSSRDPQRGWDVFVMNADGTNVVNVSNNPSTDLGNNSEAVVGWSPDGRVVITSPRDGTTRAYRVNADGSGIEPLFDDEQYLDPYWSPAGSRLLGSRERDGDAELWVMGADGTGAVDISASPAYDYVTGWAPTPWSPDGTKIAFLSNRTGNLDIFVADANGGGLVNVTADPANEMFLDWSPDGSRLLFSSDRTGDAELWVVNADGSGLTNLSNAPFADEDRSAIWVPR